MLTTQIKEFIDQQKLGFVATVCPDGSPNLSPKGTVRPWGEDHLVFLDIYSPGTVSNLLQNPSIELNVVDIFTRKGYRFKGKAEVISGGKAFEEVMTMYGEAARKYTINHAILVRVDRVLEVTSPAYGIDTEAEIKKRWIDYWGKILKF